MNKKALHKISYGLYVVCSKKENRINGQIANTVFQITSQPPTIAVSINKQNLTHNFIKESKIFTVSILAKDTPMKLIGTFGFKSGREVNKFENINYKIGKTGAPLITDYSIAYIEAKVLKEVDVETHTLFIGEVIEAEILNDREPMTYEYYHKVKKGKSPKAAPTYIEDNKKEERKMDRYVCKICGYVYDPQKGDPEAGIPPGTPFEKLPDDWTCPICGAGKEDFEKETKQ